MRMMTLLHGFFRSTMTITYYTTAECLGSASTLGVIESGSGVSQRIIYSKIERENRP